MRSQSFDWVIDLQGLARSGVFAWLANGALTVGLDDRREQAQLFYDLIGPRLSHEYHAVDWYLSVLPLLGLPAEGEFEWFPPRPLAAAAVRQKWPIEDKRWIIFQPGARWLNKRWPVEYFAELARLMAASYPECRFAILGGADDRSLGEVISSAVPGKCLDLTGKLSLPEMVEWIRLSEMMVSNDTGPMHVAAALEKLVVALMGPTEPRRTGPYNQTRHVLQINLPCVPCFKSHCTYVKPLECLRALTPAMVFASVRERLRS
jgi:ADP-heptose:LPS heptosyltransferase